MNQKYSAKRWFKTLLGSTILLVLSTAIALADMPVSPEKHGLVGVNPRTPEKISDYVQRYFKPATDEELFGASDYWQSPREFRLRRAGDCEDYALFIQHILRRRGFEAHVVSLYGPDLAHTVVVYRQDGVYRVMDWGRILPSKSRSIGEAISSLSPQWVSASLARQRGTRGWALKEFRNPSPVGFGFAEPAFDILF